MPKARAKPVVRLTLDLPVDISDWARSEAARLKIARAEVIRRILRAVMEQRR